MDLLILLIVGHVGIGGNFLPVPIEKINNIEYNGDTIRSINEDTVDRSMERSASGKGCIITALRQIAIKGLEKIPRRQDRIHLTDYARREWPI